MSHGPHYAFTDGELVELSISRQAPTTLPVARVDKLMSQVSLGRKVSLLTHQVSGIRLVLSRLRTHGFALLADEMGLGKTLTAMGAMLMMHRFNIDGARDPRSPIKSSGIYLVICPKATIAPTWRVQIKQFTDVAQVFEYAGEDRESRLVSRLLLLAH